MKHINIWDYAVESLLSEQDRTKDVQTTETAVEEAVFKSIAVHKYSYRCHVDCGVWLCIVFGWVTSLDK